MNDSDPLPKQTESSSEPNWERATINKLLLSVFEEQRKARRWNIIFKSLLFVYLFALLVLYFPRDFGDGLLTADQHTSLVEVRGIIASGEEANADNVITGLRDAFKDKKTKAVILRINSPGGSPVQSGYINDEVFRLREQHPTIPVYAVITDICASGGYYIATAANEIYADKASLIGSIGVVMDGFGFVGTMEKLGVERRVWTAGKNKGMLDPFSPLKIEDSDHIQGVINSVHQQFINVVKKGRGNRLKTDANLFTGLVWTGEQGLELGLVDALGSSSYVAREIVGAEKIVDYTPRQQFIDRFAKRLGTAVVNSLAWMQLR